jgi:uncharacterized radical SAM superfamily protein
VASILHAYFPGKAFPALSVTGGACGLMCSHCEGKHLRGMRPALTPAQLEGEIATLMKAGARGLLLSGGCDAQGRVPLDEFVAVLAGARRNGLQVNLHPGLCDEARARRLAPAADVVSLDLLCDDAAARNSLHLPSAARHIATLHAWAGQGPEVVPHLLVGLGGERSEMEGIAICRTLRIRRLILLALIPPPGGVGVASGRFLRVVQAALEAVPEVALGCMRPRGDAALEVACLDLGVKHVANPSRAALAHAEKNGMEIRTVHACCSLS